jgi:hypothetical protein
MAKLQNKTRLLFVTILILVFLFTSCKFVSLQKSDQLSEITTFLSPSYGLNLTEISDENVKGIFSDRESKQIFNSISSLSASDLLNVHIIGKFGKSADDLQSGTYFVMKPEETFLGYMLLVNTLKYNHDFGIVAAVDYQPVMININGETKLLPTFGMKTNTIKGYAFELPPLEPGLHTLTLSLIIEPDYHFVFKADEFIAKDNEAAMFRNSPMEMSVLIWVTDDIPTGVEDWPEQTKSIFPKNTSSINAIVALREKAESGKPALMFQSEDTVTRGETVTYYLNFVAPILGKGPFDTILVVLWDDQYFQTQRLTFDAAKIQSDKFFPINFTVPDQLEKGDHTLTIIAYPYPYYLHWWEDGQEWHPNITYFSYITARLPVKIQ